MILRPHRIAAVVVLYNPDCDLISNIQSYLNQVDKLYIIDNSDKNLESEIRRIKSSVPIFYKFNNSNIGIAAALNIGINESMKEGYDYILTMDQDSSASELMVERLYSIIVASNKNGIVAAYHFDPTVDKKESLIKTEEILFTMTSGNLLSLEAVKTVGDFWEELFIDHVDHEFCLRLNKFGYRVIKTNFTLVHHKLGQLVKHSLFNHTLWSTNHPPIRLYYRFRNRFFVKDRYKKDFPKYIKIDNKNIFFELLSIFLFETNRIAKLKMIIKGYIHYKYNILGPYQY